MGERNNRQGSGQGGNFLCMEQTIPKGESPKATQRGKLFYYLPVNNNQCGHSLLSSFPRDPMLRIFCLKSTNVLLGPGKFTSQNESKRQTFWTEPIGTCPVSRATAKEDTHFGREEVQFTKTQCAKISQEKNQKKFPQNL